MKLLQHIALAGLSVVAASFAFAESSDSIDPVDLMRRVEAHASSPDEVVSVTMRLVDSSGKISSRSAKFYQKKSTGNEDMKLIRFNSPAEMDGSAVLTLEKATRSDDQWIYLPAYHTSRKIPASSRSDRYMGTDFYYEDVSDDKISQYEYKVLGQDEIDGHTHVVIEQVPKADEVKRDSAYGKKVQWVDPEKLLVSRIDFYNKEGELIKRYTAQMPLEVGDYWRWQKALMEDLKSDHRTEIEYSGHKIGEGLESNLFTVRNLERGR